MASTVARTAEKLSNRAYIVNLLSTHPGVKYTGETLCDSLGMSRNTKNTTLNILKRLHPEIKSAPGRAVGSYYWWEEKKTTVKNETPSKMEATGRYAWHKNSEGYPDMTAGAAIEKVDRELAAKAAMPKTGEVWSAKHHSGTVDLFYILWTSDNQASGIYLDMDTDVAPNPKDEKAALTNRIFATLDKHKTVCIATKPIKYLLDKVGETNGIVATRVKNTIARQLNIMPVVKVVEKPVEKVVEKVVEKPVEKVVEKVVYKDHQEEVPDGYVHWKDAVISDLCHQLEFYKEMLDRVAPVKETVA